MKKFVKLVKSAAVLTLAIVMSVSTIGCGKSGDTKTESATTTPSASPEAAAVADGPFEKYADPVTITSVKNLGAGNLDFPEGDDINNNVWTREYKDALNIDVKLLWTTNEQQYDQKLNIAITSNDLPDVMVVKNTQLKMMYENDQLMDMTQILPKYQADFTKEVLEADGGDGLKSATFDGKLMAIPVVGTGLMSCKVLWVRTDWLDKLGLELPKTVDDMLKVSDAFTNDDPDGNGVKDTFGLAIHKDLFESGYASLEGFFNAYNAYPLIWVKKDNALAYGTVQPEAKTALAVLQDLYAKGQIDPEFGVKDANKVNEEVGAGKFGMFFGDFWNMAWLNDVKVDHPEMEWVPIAIPSNNGTPAKAGKTFGTGSYIVINKNCKNPEAVVKMINLQLEKSYGATAEPTVYNITPDGYGPYAYTIPCGIEPGMKNFIAAQKVSDAIKTGDTSKLNDEEKNYYDMCKLAIGGDYTNNNWHQLKMFGPDGSLSVINKYWTDGNVMSDEFYGAPTETISEKLSTLKKQTLTDFTAIIMGAPIDDFDKFVTNWNNLGGKAMTDEVNAWYAEQQK